MKMLRPVCDNCFPVFAVMKCFIALEFCTAKRMVIFHRDIGMQDKNAFAFTCYSVLLYIKKIANI